MAKKKLVMQYSNFHKVHKQNLKSTRYALKEYGGEINIVSNENLEDNDFDYSELMQVNIEGNHGTFQALVVGAKFDEEDEEKVDCLYIDCEDSDNTVEAIPLSWMSMYEADCVCEAIINWYNDHIGD